MPEMVSNEPLYARMRELPSPVLKLIIKENSPAEWSEAAIDAARAVLLQRGQEPGPEPRTSFDIDFKRGGVSFASDGFGFVDSAVLTIAGSNVTIDGQVKWSIWARIGVFVGITIVPLFLIGTGLGILLALLAVYRFCSTKHSESFEIAALSNIARSDRTVSFDVNIDADSYIPSRFRAQSIEEAMLIMHYLTKQ